MINVEVNDHYHASHGSGSGLASYLPVWSRKAFETWDALQPSEGCEDLRCAAQALLVTMARHVAPVLATAAAAAAAAAAASTPLYRQHTSVVIGKLTWAGPDTEAAPGQYTSVGVWHQVLVNEHGARHNCVSTLGVYDDVWRRNIFSGFSWLPKYDYNAAPLPLLLVPVNPSALPTLVFGGSIATPWPYDAAAADDKHFAVAVVNGRLPRMLLHGYEDEYYAAKGDDDDDPLV